MSNTREDQGIVARLRKLLAEAQDAETKATLDEAIDLLCQAGWGQPFKPVPVPEHLRATSSPDAPVGEQKFTE